MTETNGLRHPATVDRARRRAVVPEYDLRKPASRCATSERQQSKCTFRCGIIFINHNGLRWRDPPKEYGPPKTLYNRWKRWSYNGVFARIMVGLATERAEHKTIMIDATYLKAHRTASSLGGKKGARAPYRAHQRWHEHQVARCRGCEGAADRVLHVRRTGQRLYRIGGTAGQPAEGGVAARR